MSTQPQPPLPAFLRDPHHYQLTLYTAIGTALAGAWLLTTLLLTVTLRRLSLGGILVILGIGLTWYLIVYGVTVAVVAVQGTIFTCSDELRALIEAQRTPDDGKGT